MTLRFLAPTLACDQDGNVYVASAEQFRNSTRIFFARSDRYGEAWHETFQYLDSNAPGDRGRPQLAVGGRGEVYALWEDTRSGSVDLYCNRSLDAGRTWLPQDARVNTGMSRSRVAAPVLLADANGNVTVLWYDDRDGFDAFYANRSNDRGETWLPADVRVTPISAALKSVPRVSRDSRGGVYLVWIEADVDRQSVWLLGSRDHGETWSLQPTRLDGPTLPGTAMLAPAVCTLESGAVLVAWTELQAGRASVVLVRVRDEGRQIDRGPTPISTRGQTLFDPSAPELACDPHGRVVLAWQARTAQGEAVIVVNTSIDEGRTFAETRVSRGGFTGIGEELLFGTPAASPFRMRADAGGNVYLAWVADEAGAPRVAFERLSSPSPTVGGMSRFIDPHEYRPVQSDALSLCADDAGHVFVLWNAGSALTVGSSSFYGDSGWRFTNF